MSTDHDSIVIKTRLDDGIYRADGGGRTVTKYRWKATPLKLLAAIEVLRDHRDEMKRIYGGIGCGQSWIEIYGHEATEVDLFAIEDDEKHLPKECRTSRTARAFKLLADLRERAASESAPA